MKEAPSVKYQNTVLCSPGAQGVSQVQSFRLKEPTPYDKFALPFGTADKLYTSSCFLLPLSNVSAILSSFFCFVRPSCWSDHLFPFLAFLFSWFSCNKAPLRRSRKRAQDTLEWYTQTTALLQEIDNHSLRMGQLATTSIYLMKDPSSVVQIPSKTVKVNISFKVVFSSCVLVRT